MTFGWPGVLPALLVLPVLVAWYEWRRRRGTRSTAAFHSAVMTPSVAPRRPGARRHAPLALLAVATALLILAAARPSHPHRVAVKGAGIILANDVSSSMSAADVKPTRLEAAREADLRFLKRIPRSISLGVVAFARRPALLQTPTADRALAREAITRLQPGGGGTAIGDTIRLALRSLDRLRISGKRPPGAILLLSDGVSNVGVSPLVAAAQARSAHVPVYTIALGTPNGIIPMTTRGHTVTAQVPVSTDELRRIASASGGRAFTAADSTRAQEVYAGLAVRLGTRRAAQDLTAAFVAAGAIVLLGSVALSLFWFGRIA